MGAGVVHAAAAGAHGEHRSAVVLFTALAAAQLGWGALALWRRDRAVAGLGVALGVGALVGWALAKTVGLPPIGGLDVAEPVQLADGLAAVLALAALVLAALAVEQPRGGFRLPLWTAVVAVGAVSVAGTFAAPSHQHPGGAVHAEAVPHDDGAAPHTDEVAHAEPVPYDPALPIDLGGTPGVSPQQQAAAENLVAVTLSRLPQWADPAVAEAAGFRSIGDGFTGTEHLVHRGFQTDDTVLDPDRPESLVYDTSAGGRRLVAAMYMLAPGTPLAQVPDVGGALVQWHTHENLCYNADGQVRGITDATGACPAGLVKPVPSPMVHVWITPHRCGPFAALEGIAGGRIPDGEARLCDHAHGAKG